MIDNIVELIIHEASKRPGKDRAALLIEVMMEVDSKIIDIIVIARNIEREAKDNVNEK